jgi:hypothetical protein
MPFRLFIVIFGLIKETTKDIQKAIGDIELAQKISNSQMRQ